jgi:hypothetical protein
MSSKSNWGKKLDICIPVLNDLDIAKTLDSIIKCDLSGYVRICISDNASEKPISEVVSKFSDKLEILYSRSSKRLSFEHNFVRSGEIGKSDYLTCCGAGDLFLGNDLMSDVEILEKDRKVALLGSAQLIRRNQNAVQVRQKYDSELDVRLLKKDEFVDWVFNGPLSGIGSWIVRRVDFERSVLQTKSIIDGSAFPQIVMALNLAEERRVIQSSGKWYVGTYELDRSRMRNKIYQDVEWILRIKSAIPQNIDQQLVKSKLSTILIANLIGFKAFGGRKILKDSILIERQLNGISYSSWSRFAIVKIIPKTICLAAVYLKRKCVLRIAKTIKSID